MVSPRNETITVEAKPSKQKRGAYSAPTSMLVPSLKRNVILLSACTVAVSDSVSHSPSSQVSRTRAVLYTFLQSSVFIRLH